MAELTTLARPYAKAAFAVAQETDALGAWFDMLQAAAQATISPEIQALIGNPQVVQDQISDLLIELAAKPVGDAGSNFIRLLITNGRLQLLPDITAHFAVLKADAERTLTATVTSAVELSDAQREKLLAGLKKRFDRDVNASYDIDPSLVGGAVIRVGDLVIDGSVRSKLDRLATTLAH